MYSIDQGSRLPLVESTPKEGTTLEIGKIGRGKYYVIQRHGQRGPVMASYRVEGEPVAAVPEVSLVNFLALPEFWLYPFIGGTPK